nr:polysaccharide deacetylase family protein [uncultured Roseateles sp.]
MNAFSLGLVTQCTRLGFDLLGTLAPPRLSVLTFHRVHARPDALFPGEPDAERFDLLMRLVAGSFRVLSLAQAAEHLEQATLPARSLVLTFDDGYADNAEIALPILQRHGLKASFFVSSGFLDGGRMWNDSVIECLRASRLASVDLGEFSLSRLPLESIEQRQQAVQALLPRIKYLSLDERETALARLRRLCAVEHLPQDLMMSTEQLRSLHRAGMEIGGHTVSHPILTTLDGLQAEREIAQGRQRLQELIDTPVQVFAYPNGKPGQDYDASHAALVRKLGFRAAVSTAAGAAAAGADLFQLPRFTPWAKGLPVWAARLALNQRRSRYDRAVAA